MKAADSLAVAALIALLVGTGIGKIRHAEPIENNLDAAEVPQKARVPLGSIELVSAAGIIVGLRWRSLGVLTSALLLPYFTGAVLAHVRAGDKNIAPAGSGLLLSIATLRMFLRGRRRSQSVHT